LENLAGADPAVYAPLKTLLQKLTTDKNERVRQVAIRLFSSR
jgi:hypothetical protein